MKFVIAKGFDFTDEELTKVTGNLTDGELEAITGGTDTTKKDRCQIAFEKGIKFLN